MTIETATYISDLNVAYPGATDPESEGDDHIRLIKTVTKATFPNVTGAVTASHTELGYVAGVTSSIQTQLNTHTTNISTAQTTANAALPKAGGTMSGAIAMGSNKITGLANGTASGDAVSFGQTFVASGASHAVGLVPDPGAVAGTTKFLREDATWVTPPAASPGGSSGNIQTNNGSGGFGAIAPGTGVAAALANALNGASGLVSLDASSKLPAVDGSQLTNISAQPKAQTTSGVGQFVAIGGAASNSAAVLPAGGTWLWFAGYINNTGSTPTASPQAGISAGSTTVLAAVGNNGTYGFAWRLT